MKLNTLRRRPVFLEGLPEYREKILERLRTKKENRGYTRTR
jgi:hypothetical protein